MRKVLDIAFAEGNRLGVPVILETDAKSKCEKYVHLGMELAETHDLGAYDSSVMKKGETKKFLRWCIAAAVYERRLIRMQTEALSC